MDWRDLPIDSFGRITEFLERALKGLSREDLEWQPTPETNSIGWLVWHLTRQQDAQVASLMGEQQLWTKEGWHARFNRPKDPRDTGFGNTPEQVAAFKSPEAETLLAYNRAVVERSRQYLRDLTDAELGRELDEKQWTPVPTVGVRLVSVLNDSVLHAGQAAYVRGLRQGLGWQKF